VKYFCITLTIIGVLVYLVLRIPHTRVKIIDLGEQLAEWHEKGLAKEY